MGIAPKHLSPVPTSDTSTSIYCKHKSRYNASVTRLCISEDSLNISMSIS